VLDRILVGAGDLASGRPWAVVATSALVLVFSIVGATRVELSHNPLTWLAEDLPVRQDTERIDRELQGSITLEVVLQRQGENAWYDPDLLDTLDSVQRYAEAYEDDDVFVGRAFSLVDVLKEIHRALNENQVSHYRVPDERELIAQEFLLFENSGSDDLEDLVDSQFSQVRLTLKAPWRDANRYSKMLPELEDHIRTAFGEDTTVVVTGIMTILFRTMSLVSHSMVRSYSLAFVIITILMVLLIGSLRLGLIAMIPNLLPVAFALGVMGYAGMPLDNFTLLVGSIALGLAVDDTIHFMHNYRRYLEETGDSRQAIHNTLQTAGRALLFTTLVLSTGFFIFAFASMSNIANFGILTGLALIVALLADFFLAPALMQIIHAKRSSIA
jgi:predicted RND superfamily exporter protein